MSKRNMKAKKRNLSVPLLAAADGLMLIVARVLFALRGNSNSAGGNGIPDIKVSPEVIDYGDVKLDTPLTFQIAISNDGDGTLRIEDEPYLEVLEGC